MGRVVELTNCRTGEKIPSIISIDHLTNEVIAFRQDWIKVPDNIKGVKLNEEQKQDLRNGKAVYLEGLDFKNTENKNAYVQYNADKRRPEFLLGIEHPGKHRRITQKSSVAKNFPMKNTRNSWRVRYFMFQFQGWKRTTV